MSDAANMVKKFNDDQRVSLLLSALDVLNDPVSLSDFCKNKTKKKLFEKAAGKSNLQVDGAKMPEKDIITCLTNTERAIRDTFCFGDGSELCGFDHFDGTFDNDLQLADARSTLIEKCQNHWSSHASVIWPYFRLASTLVKLKITFFKVRTWGSILFYRVAHSAVKAAEPFQSPRV